MVKMFLFHINDKVETCIVLERVNRFVVRVLMNNKITNAHITNTGRLYQFLERGRRGYCVRINGLKLKYRLFAISDHDHAALIDIRLQEHVFEYLISTNNIEWLKNCIVKKRNPRLNKVIIDYLLLCDNSEEVYVELKSAVLRIDRSYATYPDCPTLRGRRQVRELIKLVEQGGKACIVFIAGLPSVKAFKPYIKGDPVLVELIKKAYEKGVVLKSIKMYYLPRENNIVVENTDLTVKF